MHKNECVVEVYLIVHGKSEYSRRCAYRAHRYKLEKGDGYIELAMFVINVVEIIALVEQGHGIAGGLV